MVDWKRSLLKTVIYRLITLVLGTLTAYVATQDLAAAGGVALLTEFVQSINYFIYETIWSHFEERRIRKKVEEEFMNKEVQMMIDFNFLRDLSYELSQMDTFIDKVYFSIIKFFDRMLENEELETLHDEILKHKAHFELVHQGRNFKPDEGVEQLDKEEIKEIKEVKEKVKKSELPEEEA
ncbi:MAG: DUF2061 domain-containing protein [Candidatus Lokiarchaeota archaeon]|nr:DUF2061 domain-containing protein [Candidatus Lokiarchaeota archaeon]MBD3199522.1 DUF2061 domain-containing protein [Candidatus Lokiarchaeota archaeon]